MVAVAQLVVAGTIGDPRRPPSKPQCGSIQEHMSRIGYQNQRVGHQASDQLNDHETSDQEEGSA